MSSYVDKLREFAALEEGWDSYGAAPIAGDALEAMRVFLDAVQCGEAQLLPTRNGGVQLEVHSGGWDIEFEIDPSAGDMGVACWTFTAASKDGEA